METEQSAEINFSVFLIHRLAEAWNTSSSDVYRVLDSTGILGDYVFPCYDTLHIQFLDALVLVEDLVQNEL